VIARNLAFAALVSLTFLSACGGGKKPEAASAASAIVAAIPVEIARASQAGTANSTSATGTFGREREIILSFRSPGILSRLTVEVGDTVTKGQVIATIDPTQLDARARAAQADAEKAQRDLNRDKALAEKGFVSAARLADRETALVAARANVTAATFDTRFATLVAPASGVVLTRNARAGEVVGAGQPIISIGDVSSPLILKVPLSDRDVAQVRLGDSTTVTVPALDATLPGTVTRIQQSADSATGVFLVQITVPARPDLKTGFVGKANLVSARTIDVPVGQVSVPAEAVFGANGKNAFVYGLSADGKKAKKIEVRFDGFQGERALIGGIAPGAAVVTAGGGYIDDGSPVTTVEVAAQ
jgi:RND family efflux transporter MFP subunit